MTSAVPLTEICEGTGTKSVAALLREYAAKCPDKPYVHFIDQSTHITYGEMFGLANQFAHFCAERRLGAGAWVMLFGDNSLEYAILQVACMRTGVAVCPVNLEMNQAHILDILRAVRPAIVLCSADLDPKAFGRSQFEGEWLTYGRWRRDGAASAGDELFSALALQPRTDDVPPLGTWDDASCITYTSGTTSQPKGVVSSHRSDAANTAAFAQQLGVRFDDRILDYRSLSWASGQSLGFKVPLLTGATSAVASKFSASHFFEWLGRYEVTIAVGVPTVINMLIGRSTSPEERSALARVRFMTSSTSALLPDQQRRFEETYGIRIVQAYGMSEGGWIAASNIEERRPGSVGRPLKFQDLRIIGSDGSELPRGEDGEIEVGGPQRAMGYLGYDGQLEAFGDTRLRTGDIGHLDAQGFLFITGRSKDLIIRGGANIAPLEIDTVLQRHPDIVEAATVGVPDPIYGEEVVCYVVARAGSGLDAATVHSHCEAFVPQFKRPKEVILVDAVPKTARGKIDRKALVETWKRNHPTAGN